MDSSVSIGDVANIITFVAPGYFALIVYAYIFAKGEKDFSKLLIESVIFSLPLVALTHFIWQVILRQNIAGTVNAGYTALLIVVSVAAGIVAASLRIHPPIKTLAARFGFGMPDEDFVRVHFARLKNKSQPVAVTLKSGRTFSGTPKRGTVYSAGDPQKYYFTNVAWYNLETEKWEETNGGIIIDLEEVEYIATPPLKED